MNLALLYVITSSIIGIIKSIPFWSTKRETKPNSGTSSVARPNCFNNASLFAFLPAVTVFSV